MTSFLLDADQEKKLAKWKKKHKKCKSSTEGVKFIYEFVPTGLGTIAKVKCLCGKEIDLTDSENW